MVEDGLDECPALVQTILDAVDVRGLAEFYRLLLGLVYRAGDEAPTSGDLTTPTAALDTADWLVLTTPGGAGRPRAHGGTRPGRRARGPRTPRPDGRP